MGGGESQRYAGALVVLSDSTAPIAFCCVGAGQSLVDYLRLTDIVGSPDLVGRGWPGRFAEATVVWRALLGIVVRDLVDESSYRTLVAPVAAVLPWLRPESE
jgi:hypothetical protein